MQTAEIENKLGYCFKNKALLERAFTHSSKSKNTDENYQSLEFLGDSILDFIIADRLMEIYPHANEGELTRMRAGIVSRQPLSDAVESMGLIEYLEVGKGENKSDIVGQLKIKSDIYEAVVAAIYYDTNDVSVVREFILRTLANVVEYASEEPNDRDSKSKLNEYCAKHDLKYNFELVEQTGKSNAPVFVYDVYINGKNYGRGDGRTKRDAQQMAAEAAFEKINKKNRY